MLAEVGVHAEGIYPFQMALVKKENIMASTLLHITAHWQHRPTFNTAFITSEHGQNITENLSMCNVLPGKISFSHDFTVCGRQK